MFNSVCYWNCWKRYISQIEYLCYSLCNSDLFTPRLYHKICTENLMGWAVTKCTLRKVNWISHLIWGILSWENFRAWSGLQRFIEHLNVQFEECSPVLHVSQEFIIWRYIYKVDYVHYVTWWEVYFLTVLNISDDRVLHLVLIVS